MSSLILDDATLSADSLVAIRVQAFSIADVSLVGLRFSDAMPDDLSKPEIAISSLLGIKTLDNIAIDQSLIDTHGDELTAFAVTEGNTLTIIGYGDANKDGEFNSSDFVEVFAAGEYEDGIAENSYWTTGDWNNDGDFDSSDLVIAFRDGRYEQGPVVNAVPEPSSAVLLLVGLLALVRRRR